jgi:hypothetical protein
MKFSNKNIIFLFYSLLMTQSVFAEDPKKEKPKTDLVKELSSRIHVSQISFTNWAKGGDNIITYNTGLTAGLKKETAKYSWFIHGDCSFGQTKQGDKGVRNTLDRIDLDASVTFKKKRLMNPFFLLTLDTQFARGYNYKKDPPVAKSDFRDPIYLVQSFGTGVQFSSSTKTKLGFAMKETFTNDFRQYSDNPKTKDKTEWFKIEHGLNSRTDFSCKIKTSMSLVSKLELFSNLNSFKEIDVRWDTKFQTKLAKYISVNFNIYTLYDYNISKKTQIKQFMGIGFTYNFF